jgi:hypothetical protein
VKYELSGQKTSCWVGQDKQGRDNIEESWRRAQSNQRMRPGWTYSQGAARMAARVCIKCTWVCCNVAIHMKRKYWDIKSYLYISLII